MEGRERKGARPQATQQLPAPRTRRHRGPKRREASKDLHGHQTKHVEEFWRRCRRRLAWLDSWQPETAPRNAARIPGTGQPTPPTAAAGEGSRLCTLNVWFSVVHVGHEQPLCVEKSARGTHAEFSGVLRQARYPRASARSERDACVDARGRPCS